MHASHARKVKGTERDNREPVKRRAGHVVHAFCAHAPATLWRYVAVGGGDRGGGCFPLSEVNSASKPLVVRG